MKRLFIIFAMLLSYGAFSQAIQWGQDYEPEDDGSIYNYVGSIGETQYYSFGYQTTAFVRRFNRVGLMSVTKNNVKTYNPEYFKIPLFSQIKTVPTSNEIAIIYSEENKDIDKNQVKSKLIDKNTLLEKSEKVLLAFNHTRRDDPKINLYISKDKSKYVITYMNVNSKTDEGYYSINVYDKDFNKIWDKRYSTENEGTVYFMDVAVNNNGEVFLLTKIKTKEDKTYLSKLNDEEITEYYISEKITLEDSKLHLIDDDNVFVGNNSEGKFSGYTFKLSTEEITNTASFEYKKEKGTLWVIKDILTLENGNIVAIVQDAYLYIYETTKTPPTYTYFNRSFYALCINPNQSNLVYNQLVSKATRYFNRWQIEYGQFERPLFFTKGNDFYAIYNTDKDDNDLSGEVFIETNITFPKGKKVVVTNLMKISPEGKPTLKTLFSKKESQAYFSENLSFMDEQGNIVLGRFKGDILNFGTMKINN